MKVIIIEDEALMAQDLHSSLTQLRPEIEVVCTLASIKESVEYLSAHPQPDIIFCDIQLGDGLSFEISKHVKIQVPIIFCTAFDEYAIEAFRANGIEFILKPFSLESLERAITKYDNLRTHLTAGLAQRYESAMKALSSYQLGAPQTLTIKFRDRYLPLKFDKIALFYLDHEINHLYMQSGEIYLIPHTLEEIERKAGPDFFRVNRQFLVNRKAVKAVSEQFPRKLKVDLTIAFERPIIASKEKRTRLLEWVGSTGGTTRGIELQYS